MRMQEVINKVLAGKKIIYKRINTIYDVKEKVLPSGKRFIACVNQNNESDYASISFIFENQQYMESVYSEKRQSIDDIDIKSFIEVK